MNADNDASEHYEEPTVIQYQVQLENLDYELKMLKGKLFLLEQEHTREQIRISSKISAAHKALEAPLKELEDAQNNAESSQKGHIQEIKNQIKEIEDKKEEKITKINDLNEKLSSKYEDESVQYEKMSMLENDLSSTDKEITRFEKEISELDSKTEAILNTYPKNFNKLTDDFSLYDKKSRIESKIIELQNKISLEKYKVNEYKNIRGLYKKDIEKKQDTTGDIQLKIKLNEDNKENIENLMNELIQATDPILQMEKFFPMFDKYFDNKNYFDNDKISQNVFANILIPFLQDVLESYTNRFNEKDEIISQYEKELTDLSDMKPYTTKIKKEMKVLQIECKKEKDYSQFLSKLINISENLINKYKTFLNTKDIFVDKATEDDLIKNLLEMITNASFEDKEETKKKFDEYLKLKHEVVKEYYTLINGSKNSNNECDIIKNQSNKVEDVILRHKNAIEEFIKEKKQYEDELKALNDTINLRSKELKNTVGTFNEQEFSEYFSLNKDSLKLFINKQKNLVVVNNEYELTREQLEQNVLIDHSRKKANMYYCLKRKYLLEYLSHLYTQENLDMKSLNEANQKIYEELIMEINNLHGEINIVQEEVNNFDNEINIKRSDNSFKNNGVNKELNEKVQNLQNIIYSLENEKNRELAEFDSQKYKYEEQISQIMQEIQMLQEQLNNKLDGMTSGIVHLFLKYNSVAKDFNPEKDNFNPKLYGYSQREFTFIPEQSLLVIRDVRNNIIEKKIKYEWIKRFQIDTGSVKLLESIETKAYRDEKEKNKDPNRKKKIKFFIVLRKSNLDVVAKDYNDYKKFADIINTIIIHK